MNETKNFRNMEPGTFVHPAETEALERLQKVPGIVWAAAQLRKHSYPARVRATQLASALLVSEKALPKLHSLSGELSAALDVPRPELFVRADACTASYAFSGMRPLIVLNAAFLHQLDAAELRAYLAHEVSHIHCHHLSWLMLHDFLGAFAEHLGLAGSVLLAARTRLAAWRRAAFLSADRGALLLTGDAAALARMLTKAATGAGDSTSLLGAVDSAALSEQSEALANHRQQAGDKLSLTQSFILPDFHGSFAAERAAALTAWAASEAYEKCCQGEYPERSEALRDSTSPILWGAFAPGGGGDFSALDEAATEDVNALHTETLVSGLKQAADGAFGLAQDGAALLGKMTAAFFDNRQSPAESPRD